MISPISFPSIFLTKSLFHLQATSVYACLLYPRRTAASILNKIAPLCEQDSSNLRRKQSNKDGIHLISLELQPDIAQRRV